MKEFNSQVCTTKIQSQRLLELGLKPETADMYIFDNEVYIGKPNIDDIPAWSLHRLLCMCEVTTLLPVDNSSSVYDHIIDVIERFINKGYFNKEYLKQ